MTNLEVKTTVGVK